MSLVSERPISGPPHYTGGSCKHSKLPKISLVSAMRDFQAMFPDLPPMAIEAVLRANGGAVDPTVEKLISMCCEQQKQKKKADLELDSDALPGYYDVIYSKEQQSPPSYHASQTYSDASTQTEPSCKSDQSVIESTLTEDIERLELNDSQLSSTSDSSNVVLTRTDDEKMALYLQNRELIQQLKRKQRIIEYLERNGTREHNGIKPHRHSDPVMSLVPCFDGPTGVAMQRVSHSRSRRTQTMSIQRQQNTSPPPNATVDSKETLDIPDHSMLPTITRNQPTRKSAKKRLQNLSKRLWRRNGSNDVPPVSPTSSQAHLLQQDNDSISSYSVSHC